MGLSFKLPASVQIQAPPPMAGAPVTTVAHATSYRQTACVPFAAAPPSLTSAPASAPIAHPAFSFAPAVTTPLNAPTAANRYRTSLHAPPIPFNQRVCTSLPAASLVLRHATSCGGGGVSLAVSLLNGHKQEGIKGSAPEHNQWDVPSHPAATITQRFYDLVTYVMCRGCCVASVGRHPKSVLGDWGHLQRFPVWSHVAATVLFFGYSISCSVRFNVHSATGSWAIAASWATTAAFLASAVYHVGAPDIAVSAWLRQLDYLTTYISISCSALADMAAVTNGFLNVPTATILDAPLAAISLGCFFLWRRSWLTIEDTTIEEYEGYSVRTGLYRRWHSDGEHSVLRQTGGLCVAMCYFTSTPALITYLGSNAIVVLTLQVMAFLLALAGMIMDSLVEFPDAWLNRGKKIPCTSFPWIGCVITNRGIWHFCNITSSMVLVCAREFAIAVL